MDRYLARWKTRIIFMAMPSVRARQGQITAAGASALDANQLMAFNRKFFLRFFDHFYSAAKIDFHQGGSASTNDEKISTEKQQQAGK
ncbi:hypothetical protein [Microbulbifer aestuariivivens]|uniref:hypothetical protein n=1 Tax=Microbulbifer aestuariivivens TaxID=1908308 RepID=UPI0031EDB930